MLIQENDNWKKEYEKLLRKYKIEEAVSLAKKHRPPVIYKYYEISFKTDTYVNDIPKGSVCFTDPKTFNDPFDSLWHYDNKKFQQSDDIFLLFCEKDSPFHKDLKKINSRSLCRCCCFTESFDSILMWAHYAGGHTGICVEYDVNELTDEDCILMPIVYTDDIFFADQMFDVFHKTKNVKDLIYPVLFKSVAWEYEKEWRLFDLNVNYKQKNQIATYSRAVKSVYFGVADPQDEGHRDIKEYILQSLKAEQKIKLFNMKVSKEKFHLGVNKI